MTIGSGQLVTREAGTMKNTKKLWILIIVMLIAIVAAVALIIHGRNADVGENDDVIYDDSGYEDEEVIDMDEFDNGIVYDEEVEGAEISFKDAANEEDFYGSWSAESGHSLYLYGNVDLTIEEGGKWHGNIVDEDTEGTWTFDGKSMKLTSELFEVTLTFAEDGKLIMQEDREGNGNSEDFINIVLTKN